MAAEEAIPDDRAIDVQGGWSKELELTVKKLVGERAKGDLRRMQTLQPRLAKRSTFFQGSCC